MNAYTWLESCLGQMERDLVELANQNSSSFSLQGLLSVADWLEDWADFPNTSFHRVHLPPRRFIDDQGKERSEDSAPALRWDYRPEASKRVLLMIHYDTVFGSDSEFQTCELIRTDCLRGPGVADAKGGIVVVRNALKALLRFDLAGDLGWTLLLNPDEEIGSPSSHHLINDIAADFDFALLFEPSLPSGELVAQRKGSRNLDLIVQGKTAHAGRHFEEGRNAITALCTLVSKIEELNRRHPGLTVNIGAIHGGGPVNVVPDLAIARLNARASDQEATRWLDQQIDALVQETAATDGIRCRQFSHGWSAPKLITPEMQQLMKAVELASLATGGQSVGWRETGGVCDGNKLAAAGLPNIDTLGPMGAELHSTSEWVKPSSLVDKAKIVVNLLARFAVGEFGELQRQR